MEELLDILANGNSPLMLFKEKNYLNKIIQAADKLEMQEIPGGRPKIISMTASVGVEKVTFIGGGITLEGKVENYLQDVLDVVTNSMVDKAKEFMRSKTGTDRIEWINKNYAQLNLLINSIFWVQQVEGIFRDMQKGNLKAMKEYLQDSIEQLTQLIRLVQGDLTKDLRSKLMCLITVDTHNRDVIDKLIQEDVRKEDEFFWQSQLKFYWDMGREKAYCRIADAQFDYQYEYLGNGPRLVITPLTDRIYVTAT